MPGREFRTAPLLLTMAFIALGSAAQAAVILEIDVSDPTAVTFTPTTAFSEITVDETAFNGITMLNFFTGNTVTLDEEVNSGAIEVASSGGPEPLPWIFAGAFAGGWTPDDLNFYDPFNVFTISFADDAVALTGGATHDLSGMGLLPTAGTLGTLIAGEPDASTRLVLGQWKILGAVAVSEPSTLALMAVALLAFAALRRRSTGRIRIKS